MAITEEELKEIIKEPSTDIEKITTISSDGKNLLIRIPKEIVDFLKLEKGNKLRWRIKIDTKEIKIEVAQNSI